MLQYPLVAHRRWLTSLLLGLLVVSLVSLGPARPAAASVHTYHEQPGQTTLRSRQSLRDQNDMAWQATLFKRYREGDAPATYLRLVGFPGQVTIAPAINLQVQTGTLMEWNAPPALDAQTKALPENVAQYQLDAVLQDVRQPIPLILVVPLQHARPARLVVAPFVVEEWLRLIHQSPN